MGQIIALTPRAAAADARGLVTGHVVDSVTNEPLANVTISDDGVPPTTIMTNGDGDYSLAVAPGERVLTATRDGFVPESSGVFTALADVSLTMNFSLTRYASVTGVVRSDATTVGVGSVVVKFFDATTNDMNPLKSAATAADGSYVLPDLVPGAYKVQFDASSTDFISRWYDAESTRDEATILTVAPGAVMSVSGSLLMGAKISGTVTDDLGQPIQYAAVTAQGASGGYGWSQTDAAGNYEVKGLRADQYKVSAQRNGFVMTWLGGGESSQAASYYSLPAAASLTGQNIAMRVGGSISGTVGPAEARAGYISVTAQNTDGSGVAGYASAFGGDGTYTIGDLAPGQYTVSFSAMDYTSQYYANATSAAAATAVLVARGATTTGINATLVKTVVVTPTDPAVLTGIVTDLDGSLLAGVTVAGSYSGAVATTGADGTYTLNGSTRDWYLTFNKQGYLTGEAYTSPSAGNTPANPYKVSTVRLSKLGVISGKVTAGPSNVPVANADVFVRSVVTSNSSFWIRTGGDGTYTVNVPEGFYSVSAAFSGYSTTFFGGATVEGLATYVQVAQDSTRAGVDMHLGKIGSLSGTVKRGDGAVSPGASVTLVSYGFSRTITTDANGAFTFGGVPPGGYQLSASAGGQAVWWDGARTRDGGSTIEVNGDDLSGFTLALATGVTLSGTVFDAAGQRRPGATIRLRGVDDQEVAMLSAPDGSYAFRGVVPGLYRVGLVAGTSTVWLPGTLNAALGQRFELTADTSLDITTPVAYDQVFTLESTDPSVPVSTGWLSVYDSTGSWVAGGSFLDGTTSLGLFPGTYRVWASMAGFPSVSTTVTVTGAGPLTIQVTVGGSISGTMAVTGTTEYRVTARNLATGQAFTTDFAQPDYELIGLPPGDYVVTAVATIGESPCGATVWYHGSDYFTAATVGVVDRHATTGIGLSSSCSTRLSVTGTLVLPSGITLTEANVSDIGISAMNEAGEWVGTTTLNTDGTFVVGNLAPGTYTITVYGGNLGLLDGTATVTLTDTDVAGTRITLVAGGKISGRVLDAFGHPAVGVWVSASGRSTSANAYSDATGSFALVGLETGDYSVNVRAQLPYAQVTLTARAIVGSETVLPTMTLVPGGRITGFVPQGAGYVVITATDDRGNYLASQYVTGGTEYAVAAVPEGDVYLQFSGDSIVTEWWRDASSRAAATPVTVTRNAAVAGIDPTLAPSAVVMVTVSGVVTSPRGPVFGASVSALSSEGDFVDSTQAAADGTYSVSLVAGRTYTLAAQACFGPEGGEQCVSDYYRDTVTITLGTTDLTGVDLFLGPGTAFDSSPAPTVTGTLKPGQTLTASAIWDPTPDTTTWQWYADSTEITGATASTYTLTTAEIGKKLTVSITGAKAGLLTTTKTSLPTAAVTANVVVPGTVTIAGTPVVGTTLTTNVGTWTPGDVTLGYTWSRDGVAIDAATGGTYTLTASDVGAKITVTVTGTKDGYERASATSAPTGIVEAKPVVTIGAVTISGATTTGSTLTAAATDILPVGAQLSYQWHRDGVDVPSASPETYLLSASDVGHTLTVTVTAAMDGYDPGHLTSAPTAMVVAKPVVALGAATIAGTPTVGSVLTASVASVDPADAGLTYAWFRGATAIPGATDKNYTPVLEDAGATLTVKVNASRSGWDPAVEVTASVTVPKPSVVPGTVTISGPAMVGSVLTVHPGTWAPAPVALTYMWLRSGDPIAGATSATYTPVADDATHEVTVVVTGSKVGHTATTAVASAGRIQPKSLLIVGTPTIVGDPAVGSLLVADTGDWGPDGVQLSITWLRDGTAIPGVSGSYTPTLSDGGHILTIAVTGSMAGYDSATATSDPVTVRKPAVTPQAVTIAGTVAVGSELTAVTDPWDPSPVSLTYQWQRDGVDISGATTTSYTPLLSDVTHTISVVVTGAKELYEPTSATSAQTVAVPKPSVVAGTVSISGTVAVDSVLTAVPGTWTPAGATLAFQWLRDGVPISGATAGTYTLALDDVTHRVSVVVTGTLQGYHEATSDPAITATVPKPAVGAGTVTINGTPAVGSELTTTVASWTPSGLTYDYAWLRDGEPIIGATGSSYTPVLADGGHHLTVVVTGSKDGYDPSAPVTSDATAAISKPSVKPGTLTVSGSPTLFSTLTAQLTGWTPEDATYAYQWQRGGRDIPGATEAAYVPVVADLGLALTVSVTGSKEGYTSATVVSANTALVVKPVVTAGTVTITGNPLVASTLTAEIAGWAPDGVELAYQWRRNGVDIAGATNDTYVPVVGDIGYTITVLVTGAKPDHTSASKVSGPTAAIDPKDSVVAVQPTITGTTAVSCTLAAQPGAWLPGSVTFSYQWSRDGVAIPGATAATYAPVAADVGHTLTVAVTGTKDGYKSATSVSLPTAVVQSETSKLAYAAFVNAVYSDFLGRLPAKAEVDFQTSMLAIGAVSRSGFLRGVGLSEEYLGIVVTELYRTVLGREPDAGGRANWMREMGAGRLSIAKASSLFYASDEYVEMRGGSTTTDWVTTLYWNILDRDPDVGGLAMWVRYADHPAYGRAWVAEQIFESLESRERRVNGVYETLLDREAEPGGLAFWSNRVLSTGDLVLRTEIANSSEYWEKAHLRY